MKQDVTVPEVGESVSSGVLAGWLKQSGDMVSEGEDLFELETDKATLSVPAPASGMLEVSVETDSEVQVGQSVGSIDTAATQGADAGGTAAATQAADSGEGGESTSGDTGEAAAATGPAGAAGSGGSSTAAASVDDLPPAAARVAAEHNLDVSRIKGTGKDGRITKEDALRAVEEQAGGQGASALQAPSASQQASATTSGPSASSGAGGSETSGGQAAAGKEAASGAAAVSGAASTSGSAGSGSAPSAAPASGGETQTRKKLTSLRKRVAANLVASKQNSAHLTTFNEVDMSKVMEIRASHKEQFEKKHDIKLGFMSFFVKASQRALEAYPEVNAFLEEDEIVYNHFYNIGVALSSDRGLMTPVVRNVESKNFADIERQIMSFIEKSKSKKLMPDELTGGTFTISNGGVFGSMLSTPIPNPPQTAVLGMHTIQKRPVVIDDEIVARPMMYLALSYDHRMIDGREAIGFLNTIKQSIEDPTRILLDL